MNQPAPTHDPRLPNPATPFSIQPGFLPHATPTQHRRIQTPMPPRKRPLLTTAPHVPRPTSHPNVANPKTLHPLPNPCHPMHLNFPRSPQPPPRATQCDTSLLPTRRPRLAKPKLHQPRPSPTKPFVLPPCPPCLRGESPRNHCGGSILTVSSRSPRCTSITSASRGLSFRSAL